MLDSFWQKVGEGLAGEWNAQMLGPAFAFWGGGLAMWAMSTPDGWGQIGEFLGGVGMTGGVALLIAGVLALAVSGGFVQWLTLPVLRLIEGYWSPLFWKIRQRLTESLNRKVAAKEAEWCRLAQGVAESSLNGAEYERYVRLESELDNFPVLLYNRLPTRAGNTLRAAEEYPNRCYGLEIGVTWPRLWLLLPESTQKELSAARQALDWTVQLFIWGLLAMLWVVLAPWAILPGLAVAIAAFFRIRVTAANFGQLLRSAYDLHRFSLYESLRWPLPSDPGTEKENGQALTRYLKRNIPPAAPLSFNQPNQ